MDIDNLLSHLVIELSYVQEKSVYFYTYLAVIISYFKQCLHYLRTEYQHFKKQHFTLGMVYVTDCTIISRQ